MKAAKKKKSAKDSNSDEGLVDLGQCLEIGQIEELRPKLNQLMSDYKRLVIDASQLMIVDTGSLQALCAFAQHAKVKKITLSWRKSEKFQTSAELLGINAQL